MTIVGDHSDVAVSEREWSAGAFHGQTGAERVRVFAAVIRRVMESAGPAFRTAAQAAASDDDAAVLWKTGQRHRYADATAFVTSLEDSRLLRSDRTRDQAIATVWLVSSPETFIQLTDGHGLTLDEYQLWIEQTVRDTVVSPASERHRGPHRAPAPGGIATSGAPERGSDAHEFVQPRTK